MRENLWLSPACGFISGMVKRVLKSSFCFSMTNNCTIACVLDDKVIDLEYDYCLF